LLLISTVNAFVDAIEDANGIAIRQVMSALPDQLRPLL
jgi:hypothetical protein